MAVADLRHHIYSVRYSLGATSAPRPSLSVSAGRIPTSEARLQSIVNKNMAIGEAPSRVVPTTVQILSRRSRAVPERLSAGRRHAGGCSVDRSASETISVGRRPLHELDGRTLRWLRLVAPDCSRGSPRLSVAPRWSVSLVGAPPAAWRDETRRHATHKQPSVTYRNLGRTGVQVSPICLGAMNFCGPTSEEDSVRIVDAAVDGGINFIDTANVYNAGESERIVGQALKQNGRRDQVVLATKAHGVMGPGPNDQGNSRYHLMRACEESLRRLGTV